MSSTYVRRTYGIFLIKTQVFELVLESKIQYVEEVYVYVSHFKLTVMEAHSGGSAAGNSSKSSQVTVKFQWKVTVKFRENLHF